MGPRPDVFAFHRAAVELGIVYPRLGLALAQGQYFEFCLPHGRFFYRKMCSSRTYDKRKSCHKGQLF